METCPKCSSLLQIGASFMDFENDTTPDLPTKAFTNLPMICLNKQCENYAGEDTTAPRIVVEVVRNQVN